MANNMDFLILMAILVISYTSQVKATVSEERYINKWTNIRWKTTHEPDYYDVMATPPPTPPPDPYAAKWFDNSTEKYLGEIIFKHFMPVKLTVKKNARLQAGLRKKFEGAEAFDVFIVSAKFIGVDDWKVREQMVINALKKDMPWDIRGLALIPFSIYEYEKAPDMISQNKLKKVAAILHTKYLIHAQGHLNKTTTLTWEQHYKKMEKVAERVYGSVGDKNVKDCSHSEYRDLVDDYNEYVEDRYVKNEKHYMDRLAEMRKARLISNEEAMKKDPLIKDLKKMWTLTSYEKNMQEFDSVGERFNIDPMVDLERVTPNKYYYEDQPEENLATVFV